MQAKVMDMGINSHVYQWRLNLGLSIVYIYHLYNLKIGLN